jgi:hypothetical protein
MVLLHDANDTYIGDSRGGETTRSLYQFALGYCLGKPPNSQPRFELEPQNVPYRSHMRAMVGERIRRSRMHVM